MHVLCSRIHILKGICIIFNLTVVIFVRNPNDMPLDGTEASRQVAWWLNDLHADVCSVWTQILYIKYVPGTISKKCLYTTVYLNMAIKYIIILNGPHKNVLPQKKAIEKAIFICSICSSSSVCLCCNVVYLLYLCFRVFLGYFRPFNIATVTVEAGFFVKKLL